MRIFSSYQGLSTHFIATMIEGLLTKYYELPSSQISSSSTLLSQNPSYSTLTIRYILDILLYKTLADKLISPYKSIISNPFMTAIVTLVIYLVFCIIFVPLWLISYLITIYGSFIVLFILLHFLTIFLARNIAFPGSNPSFQKEVSSDYIRRLSHQLENLSSYTANFTATIMLIINNQIARSDLSQVHRKLQDIITAAENLPPLMISLRKASEEIIASKTSKSKEEEDILQFLRTIETFQKALADFIPEVSQLLSPQERRQSTKRQHFIVLAGRCLQASDNLRTLSSSLRPSRGDDSLLSTIQRMLFEGGPQGVEKLAFPTMRDTLVYKHNAIVFSLVGSDKNKINTIIFPTKYDRSTASSSSHVSLDSFDGGNLYTNTNINTNTNISSSSSLPIYSPSRVGMVLFCGPNAAIFESLTLASLEASWLGFYLNLGFDICFFNYRGYGTSEGSASPTKVKSDALLVYNHLKNNLKVKKILIHGESIGGMIGCHIAKHCDVDMFIADRTFASLDSIAARMMSKYIGLCLCYLGFWFTDTVTDYLDIKCPKILIQDPDDMIIHNTASLKVGIASRLLMNDSSWMPMKANHEYVLSDAMGQPLPHRVNEEEMLHALESTSAYISESFIQHFYACLVHITRCISYESERKRIEQETMQYIQETQYSSSSGSSVNDTNSWELLSTSGNNTARRRASSDHPVDSKDSSAVNNINITINLSHPSPLHQRNSNNNNSNSINSTIRDVEDMTIIEDLDTTSDNMEHGDDDDLLGLLSSHSPIMTGAKSLQNSLGFTKDLQFESHLDWLKYYSSLSIASDNTIDEYQKAWLSISLLAGVDGQLLGQAFAKGYDTTRAWLCTFLIWSTRSTPDPTLSTLGSNIKISQCIKTLKAVIETMEKKRVFTHFTDRRGGGHDNSNSSHHFHPHHSDNTLSSEREANESHHSDVEKMQRGFQSDHVGSNDRVNERLLRRFQRKRTTSGGQSSSNLSMSKGIIPPDIESCIDSIRFILRSLQGFTKRTKNLRQQNYAETSLYRYSNVRVQSIPQGFQPSSYHFISDTNTDLSHGLNTSAHASTHANTHDSTNASASPSPNTILVKSSKEIDSDGSLVDVDDVETGSNKSGSSSSSSKTSESGESSSNSSSSLVKISSPNTKPFYDVVRALSDDSPVDSNMLRIVSTTTSHSSNRSSSSSGSSSNGMNIDIGIGCLIPTHVGHNGWPGDEELTKIKEFIRCSGFDIRS